MRIILIALIQLYRTFLSPLLGPHCRFYPTCSSYAQQALQQHGVFRGLWLALTRISRCHPWHEGGVDLVPAGPKETTIVNNNKTYSCSNSHSTHAHGSFEQGTAVSQQNTSQQNDSHFDAQQVQTSTSNNKYRV